MRVLKTALLPLILCASLLTASCDSTDPAAPPASTTAAAEDEGPLGPASADLNNQLGKAAKLDVVSLNTSGDWAFVYANIVEPNGQPIDYRGTPFEEAAASGGKSKKYVGLFRDDQGWELVISRVGPTDVAWQNWSKDYSAPPEIFRVPQQ